MKKTRKEIDDMQRREQQQREDAMDERDSKLNPTQRDTEISRKEQRNATNCLRRIVPRDELASGVR